jgi:hypothetical protein
LERVAEILLDVLKTDDVIVMPAAHAGPVVIWKHIELQEKLLKVRVGLLQVPVNKSLKTLADALALLYFYRVGVALAVICFELEVPADGIIQGVADAGKAK